MSRVVFVSLWCAWGYWGCGWLPAWRRGWRGFTLILGAAVMSFVLLFTAALLVQAGGWKLTRGSWLLASAGLAVGVACLPKGKLADPEPQPTSLVRRADAWLWLAVVCAGVAIGYRLVLQPLTGYDTTFRWDFLARQVTATGGMGFYPPWSDADFLRYSWPESIPPLVSLLYAWAYMGAHGTEPWLTAIVGIEVVGLVFGLVVKLAARAAGPAAGALASAILATSAIHTWAISMGQETGVVTLGVLALVWALGAAGEAPDWQLAALAAGMTALSRDYAGAAFLAGGLVLAGMRRPWRELTGYAAGGLAVILPWYLRTWMRTGNPVYDHSLLSLFPVNPVHDDLMRLYPHYLGWWGHLADRLRDLWMQLWPLGPVVLLTGAAGFAEREVKLAGWRLLAGLWVCLWVWSVGFTMGGFQYSLRVLSPSIALLAVAGAVWLVRRGDRFLPRAGQVAIVLLAIEASLRAVLMLHAPTEFPPRLWSAVGASFAAPAANPGMDRAAALIGRQRVLVVSAYEHAQLAQRGVQAVPIWSPGLRFLFDAGVDPAAAVARLREAGVSFIFLTSAPDQKLLLSKYQFFRHLGPWLKPAAGGEGWMLFSLEKESSLRP